jgi:GntR family transcriptional regulator
MLTKLLAKSFDFSDEARRAPGDARNEALRLGHTHVRTEHLLLAVLRDETVATCLEGMGVSWAKVRTAVEARISPGRESIAPNELKYDAYAKKALEYAMAEARAAGNSGLGAFHLFIGLLREERGLASVVLKEFDVGLDWVRRFETQPADQRQFQIRLDDGSDRSIYEQIVAQITEAIATRNLQLGQRLPTVRRLAHQLDVAPGTVARAYRELEREELVITEGARGTRVAERREAAVEEREHTRALVDLLRPAVVAAFHLGAGPEELRAALETSMRGIFDREEYSP